MTAAFGGCTLWWGKRDFSPLHTKGAKTSRQGGLYVQRLGSRVFRLQAARNVNTIYVHVNARVALQHTSRKPSFSFLSVSLH